MMTRARAKQPDNSDQVMGNQRTLLKDRAYEELKELILSSALAPGTFLSERQLAGRLGMSKTPIRSAIERLEHEGFLSVSPQQGIVVNELSLDEVIDHYEIRIALETFMVRRLAGRLTKAQMARLEENLDEQLIRANEGDVLAYRELDTDFHLILCDCLDNQEIIRVMWRLKDKLNRVILRVISQRPARMLQSYEEHVGILNAIREDKPEDAAKRMAEHLEWGRRFLVSR